MIALPFVVRRLYRHEDVSVRTVTLSPSTVNSPSSGTYWPRLVGTCSEKLYRPRIPSAICGFGDVPPVFPPHAARAIAATHSNPRERDRASNVTDLICLFEGGEWIAFRNEFLRDESSELQVGDRLHHPLVVQLLRVVDLVAARDAAGMKVGDVLDVRLDRGDHIAFHDLHMVDVVQDLQSRRRDALHHLRGPRGVVGMVVLVIDLAVQHLEAERNAVFFRRGRDALEACDAVGDA